VTSTNVDKSGFDGFGTGGFFKDLFHWILDFGTIILVAIALGILLCILPGCFCHNKSEEVKITVQENGLENQEIRDMDKKLSHPLISTVMVVTYTATMTTLYSIDGVGTDLGDTTILILVYLWLGSISAIVHAFQNDHQILASTAALTIGSTFNIFWLNSVSSGFCIALFIILVVKVKFTHSVQETPFTIVSAICATESLIYYLDLMSCSVTA